VRNFGAGEARNLQITSAQPEIVENEKGLLIEFTIVGTEVVGQSMTPSLTADFGNILPDQTKIARWWMTSTVQGQFIDYEATFEHVDPLGDSRLSIIKNVEIHELIHSVRAFHPWDDGMPDFLVNDIEDPGDMPDTLYLSDGTIELVDLAGGAGTDGIVDRDDREIELTVDMSEGWSYLRLPDPGGSDYLLAAVVRSDDSQLPLENFWQTDRTFIENGQRPIDEDNLHLLDHHLAAGTYTYTLIYEPRDQVGPTIVSLEQPGDVPLLGPVADLTVEFSEVIDAASFTRDDVTLTREGGPNLINAGVTIVPLDATQYEIQGLAALTDDGGDYVLTVDAAGIEDVFGNAGAGTGTATWTRLADVPVVMSIDGIDAPQRNTPVDFLEVTFSETIEFATLTSEDVSLTLDGGDDLLGSPLDLTQIGPASYRIGSLAALTSAAGIYQVTVDATGVADLDGNPGQGSRSLSWTLDTTPPEVLSIIPTVEGMRNLPVSTLDVVFSESLAGFDLAALSLTLDGGVNLVTPAVDIEAIDGTTYRITGLLPLTQPEGLYHLTIDTSLLEDLAGNAGTTLAERDWTMDTTSPSAATNLAIAPDTGAASTDGLTNVNAVTLTGDLAEPDLAVYVFDTTTGTDFGEAGVAAMSFSHAIEFGSPGSHHLRVRAVDAAENYTDSFMDVFVDVMHPTVEAVDVPPLPVESMAVVFSESMDLATMIGDGSILSAVTLIGFPDTPVELRADQFFYEEITQTLEVTLDESLPSGIYQLRLDGGQLLDPAGNPLLGGSSGLTALDVPLFGPGEAVLADGDPLRVAEYSVPSLADFNDDGLADLIVGEKTASDEGKVRVYLNNGTNVEPAYGAFFYAQSGGADLTVVASGCLGVFPRMFDWDRDGLPDLVLGLADGTIRVARNENTAADPQFGPAVPLQVGPAGDKSELNVASRATFDIADWNNDGRYDLVVGALDGKVRVFLNEADTGAADLQAEVVVLDGAEDLTVPSGRASVVVHDLNSDGRKDLILGNTEGQLLFYRNLGTDSTPVFDGHDLLYAGGIAVDLPGTPRSRPFVDDYDNNGIVDLIVGSVDGLVRVYPGQAESGPVDELPPIDAEPGGMVVHTFQVTVPNDAPIAVDDGYTVAEGGATPPGENVVDNDTDAENSVLTAILLSDVSHGTLALGLGGTFTYEHDGSETTSDSFTYHVHDGTQYSNVATVTITILPVNDPPVAGDDEVDVEHGDLMTIAVLSNDTDAENVPLTPILLGDVAHGTLTPNPDGTFTYEHDGTETTSDGFTYRVTDGELESNDATVTITICRSLYWDENGPGNWSDIDEFGFSRWVDPDGNQQTYHPDGAFMKAFIGTDTVTVEADRQVLDLVLQSGTLVVAGGTTVSATRDLHVQSGGQYTAELDETSNGLIDVAEDTFLAGTLVLQPTENLGDLAARQWGDRNRTLINVQGSIDGTFGTEPAAGQHLDYGVFMTNQGTNGQAITYGANALEADLFQAAPGDTNGDGTVDSFDIQNILASGKFGDGPSGATWPEGDVDGDKDVDTFDIQMVLAAGLFGDGSDVSAKADGDGADDLVAALANLRSRNQLLTLVLDAKQREFPMTTSRQPHIASVTSQNAPSTAVPVAHDAVLQQAVDLKPGEKKTSIDKWAWLHEYEQPSVYRPAANNRTEVEQAVDKLLEISWQ